MLMASRWSGGSLAEEGAYARDDLVELRAREFREDGERHHLVRGLLGLRAGPFLVAEIREAGLQVERQRIVDRVPDPLRLQMVLERVALGHPDGVLIEDRLVRGI